MSENTASPRRQRADAQRNRQRLLAAAEVVFQEQGTAASLEKIARGAGVAIGTLYSHFPHRQALLLALLRERQEEVFALGDELLADGGSPSPLEDLVRWMEAVAAHGAIYSGLAAELLGSLRDEKSELHVACSRMSRAGKALLERAHRAGTVRGDITADDVFALISAASWLRGELHDEDQIARVRSVLFGGLRRI